MQFLVERADLRPALTMADRATAPRTALPVLALTRIVAADDELLLTGTDLETTITARIPAQVDVAGETTIDGAVFGDWVANVGTSSVRVELDTAKLRAKVTAGRSKATLPTLDPLDYPDLPSVDDGEPLATILGPTLRLALDLSWFVADPSQLNRPVVQGIWFQFTGDQFVVTSSDGFRMSRFTISDIHVDEPVDLIIPKNAAKMLAGLIVEGVRDVTFTRRQGRLLARIGNVEWGSALIDGRLPDMADIFANPVGVTVTVDRAAVVAALRGSRALMKTNEDKVRLDIVGGQLAIRVETNESGEMETLIDAAVVTNADLDPGDRMVNGAFLAEILNAFSMDEVCIGFPVARNQAVRITDPRIPRFTHLAMPMLPKGEW